MRVTQGMISQNSLRNISKSYEKLSKINEQAQTGKRFTKTSDDPVAAVKSLQYSTALFRNEQYKNNLNEAQNWIDTSETSVTEIIDIMSNIRDKVLDAANGTKQPEDLAAIGVEIGQMKNQIIDAMNTQMLGKFVFNGTNTNVKPVVENADGTYTFNFENYTDANAVQANISDGITLNVNSNPISAFGGQANGQNVIEMLTDLENSLKNGTFANSDDALGSIDQFKEVMSAERSDLGARSNRVDLVGSRLTSQFQVLKNAKSDNEDVESEKAILDLLQQETVNRAALATTAKVIQPSLVDFLR
ncbi:flagellar hook-associated protein FlgL [Bacillus safensis]|uniref:Flagellar hook-associated protein FlgL n=1 Tax=Bacillus safensis TaxID=561879 RepID=A0A1L6ZF35_BACIA|nr:MULTISPECIES: flagellar hook-associated protein FlgL [Bacillus]MBK4213292.1 flagellar hook-associated protein FlgL [Bacillus pumilus]MBY0191352.1 flagellar hook-associated protein FlgL [Bacillus aerophilus]APT45137.1 flagellar hook-associated protein FlgL [Bacillus safensis]AWI38338.1 flagellar biosynthesis protein FlgL [Bacillus safensis FO-36b]KDE28286.1 flagellar hook-associated protein FlgL [Bacillus safensis FO-36b]